ncbi:MAG: hypothetical protein MI861_08720 [Pirellulales bacterium]|nr:hypothetical protein [Pirellulales bacterium]
MPTRVVFGLLIGVVALTPAKGEEQLQDRVDRIAKEVGGVVGIELKEQVVAERISRDEHRKILGSQVEILLPKERLGGLFRSWQLLGLLPDDNLLSDDNFGVERLLDLTVSAIGATYNPDTKSVQLMPGAEQSVSDETVFHELVHAVQDQRHDLKRVFERLGTLASTDATMAFKLLLEGEAVFWPTLYRRQMTLEQALRLPPQAQTEIFGRAQPLTSRTIVRNFEHNARRNPRLKARASAMKRLPPLMVRFLSLPYAIGDNAVLRILNRGGRPALRQSFEDVSGLNTRDLLFPDPRRGEPRGVTEIQLASVKDKLGSQWKLKHDDTMGALVLHTMFEHREDRATEIAKSWNGDRIQLWEDEGDGVALLGLVTFETAEAAKLFESELIGLCREKWWRGKAIGELEHGGTHLVAGGDHLVIERRERSVVFLRGTGCKNPASAASSLWGSIVAASNLTLSTFPRIPLPLGIGVYTDRKQPLSPSFGRVGNELASFRCL